MNAISLFSGIGGFDLAFQKVFGCLPGLMCEKDESAIAVLVKRFPTVPVTEDITQLNIAKCWDYQQGIIYGGFPCTQTSNAGLRTGLSGKDSSLWFEMLRIVCEVKPKYVIVEQPEGIITRGLRAIIAGLRMAGYKEEVNIISAKELGAPHQRNRIFVVAYSNDTWQRVREVAPCWADQIRDDIENARLHSSWGQATSSSSRLDDGIPSWLGGRHIAGYWASRVKSAIAYPGLPRHTSGRRNCVDCYGKAVTPQQAEIAFLRIKYIESLDNSF